MRVLTAHVLYTIYAILCGQVNSINEMIITSMYLVEVYHIFCILSSAMYSPVAYICDCISKLYLGIPIP